MMAKRARTLRRETARRSEKLTRDVDRLAKLERGGAADRPLMITSPSEVEVYASDTRCPLCQGAYDYLDHTAETIEGARLRVLRVKCRQCGTPRSYYFQLSSTTLN
jgi:hypothetical protein